MRSGPARARAVALLALAVLLAAGALWAAAAGADRVAVPEPSEKAIRFYRSGNVLWLVNAAWGLLVPAAFLFTGLSARMRRAAQAVGRRFVFVVAAYFVLYAVVSFLVDLPLAYYEEFVRPHAYGLSNQALSKWAADAAKGLAVGCLMGALTLWLPFLLLRKSPRRWWLYTGILSAPFLVLVLLITPIWIDPLFNDFGPMTDKDLEARILALADRAGIEGGRVYEVKKSVDTETVNAYVAGILGTKRIVLWDTILRKLDDRELLFVMGHEMGHYVLGHTPVLIVVLSGLVLLSLYVVHLGAQGLIARFGARFGFGELADVASLPLILLLFNLTFLVASPVVLAVTRHVEHEADRFGLEITRDNHAAATAFVRLQRENLDIPRPGLLFKLWRSSHPPLGERIDFCNDYRPWERGGVPRYERLFHDAGGPARVP